MRGGAAGGGGNGQMLCLWVCHGQDQHFRLSSFSPRAQTKGPFASQSQPVPASVRLVRGNVHYRVEYLVRQFCVRDYPRFIDAVGRAKQVHNAAADESELAVRSTPPAVEAFTRPD